ncbi:sugar phosphate isomerase/epimerase family protein [Haladaptatus sp. GCM10025707]|uniref:sugar phosphate isomerase/epimerase family protein n=1 Tax=unclassified Haladaptatus TaxID=2622732 RepID=UPI0023E7E11D|nr:MULTISPECIES: sugar phosphate isomerase/epimerase [unclassified Haladaptatus]
MRFGLCTISNQERSVFDVLASAADAGYDGVEIWGRDHVGDGTAATCREIAEAAEKRGLEIPVYGSYLRPGTVSFAEKLSHELAVAERLGASLIRVWPGEQEYGDHSEAHFEQAVADLETLTRRATKRGFGVTVEKHEGTLSNTREGAERLITAVDDPNCGLNWQPLFSMHPDDLRAEAEALAPLSNNVHMQAVGERGTRDRCALSESFFDVEAVLEPFERAGFEGYVNVEFVRGDCEYDAAIEADLDFLDAIV